MEFAFLLGGMVAVLGAIFFVAALTPMFGQPAPGIKAMWIALIYKD